MLSRPMILDLGAAALLLLCFLVGGYRGLVRALSGLAALLAGVIGGQYAADRLSPVLTEWWTLPAVLKAVERLEDSAAVLADTAERALEAILAQMPLLSLSSAPLARSISALLDGQKEELTDALAGRIAWIGVFIAVFIAAQIVVRLIAGLLDRLFSLPVIGFPNRMGGALLGLFGGAIALSVALWALILFVPSLSSEGGWLSREVLTKTQLMRLFASLVDPSLL